MCSIIMLDKDIKNARFIIMNTVLEKKDKFTANEIIDELYFKDNSANNLVETCLEELIDNGLIYEIGSKYKVSEWSS